MEIGILILIILGSFIFKKEKPSGEDHDKPVPSKDMTWEEMEEYYGIILSRDSKEDVEVEANIPADKRAEPMPVTYNPVGVDTYESSVNVGRYEASVDTGVSYERVKAPQAAYEAAIEPSRTIRSRRESLRSAARHGMVWSMILEAPKGERMLRRYR